MTANPTPTRKAKRRRVEIAGRRSRDARSPTLMYERWVDEQRPARRRAEQGQARLHPHPQHGRDGPGSLRALAVLGQLRQGSDRPRRALQRRRLHARPGAELPGRQGAHLLPPARRRRGPGAALRRPQVDQAAGAAHQQPLLQRRRDLPATPSARWAWASWSASRPAASSSAPARCA